MRIAFICGSQESGKDGVGDYTRRLACEIIRQGHEAEIIAINDKNINAEALETHHDGGTSVHVFRLPSSLSWKSRFEIAGEKISVYKPDWISLQFVLFTFDKRGLPINLAKKIGSINLVRAKWHIMFHELWVGVNKEASFKLKWWGKLQKEIIKSFLNYLKPAVVHTHASIYQQLLQKLGYIAKPLPLFTNLFIDKTLYKELSKTREHLKQHTLIFSLFGGIHSGAPVEKFANDLVLYAKEKNLVPELKIIGKYSPEQDRWKETLTAKKVTVKSLGELTVNEVTRELYTSHFGLSTTPVLLVEKSSAIATMLGHKLPVICVSMPWEVTGIKETIQIQNVFKYESGKLADILESATNNVDVPDVSKISRQLLYDISLYNHQ